MAKKDPEYEDRVEDYLRQGETAALYLYGLADGLEFARLVGNSDTACQAIRRLRIHAHDLNMGPLWVRNGFKEPRPAELDAEP